MTKLRAYILCRFARRSSIYTPWLDRLSQEYHIVEEDPSCWSVPEDAGIVITHMHYRWEEISALRRLTENNRVPVLILTDGILEYRNTWENPNNPAGCIFQPVCGHKLACIGRGQARVVESWGNSGRCEVVGMPRMDQLLAQPAPPVRTEGPFRLLVATAMTPAFTKPQRQTVVDSLRFLIERFDRNQTVNNRPVEITWRLTDGLAAELELPELPPPEQPPLHEAIDQADAVITSPSTLYLESISRGRPTAVIDYWNSPAYLPPAWSITAHSHLNPVLEQLADPPPHRMMFQKSVLHEQLECSSDATPRLIQLIDSMFTAGEMARTQDQPIELPARILPETKRGLPHTSNDFDLSTLYPDNAALKERDTNLLKLELEAAVKRLGQLPAELTERETYIKQLQGWLASSKAREDALLTRVNELHQRTVRMRKHYGIDEDHQNQNAQQPKGPSSPPNEPPASQS